MHHPLDFFTFDLYNKYKIIEKEVLTLGRGIKSSNDLVPYNSKVEKGIKDMTEALVAIKVNGVTSQHELLKDMLTTYEEKHPEVFKQARKYIEIIKLNNK